MSYQEFLAADFLCGAWTETAQDVAWLRECAGSSWWSQVLLMLAELLPSLDSLLTTLAEDPSGRLRVGQDAQITYGSNITRMGQTRPVRVQALRGSTATVTQRNACCKASWTIPRGTVYVPAHQPGAAAGSSSQ